MEDKKDKEVNLNDIDAAFVISSFKNKERRNNPSSIPRALYPPKEQAEIDRQKAEKANATITSDISDEPSEAVIDNIESEFDIADEVKTIEKTTVPADSVKRISIRQRKAAFEEYKELFLCTPKIVNRKPVFISESTRNRLNKIARKLGDDNMSASGFLENLALDHLSIYEEDVEAWRKL